MAGASQTKPPIEIEKQAGVTCPDDGKGHFTITSVDREQHTVDLEVDGCPVTLSCSPQNNTALYQCVKSILLDTVAGTLSKG